jgi:hypothetical protein
MVTVWSNFDLQLRTHREAEAINVLKNTKRDERSTKYFTKVYSNIVLVNRATAIHTITLKIIHQKIPDRN